MPMPVTKETHQPREKLRMASARRSITGRAKVRLRTTKPSPRDTGDPGASGDCLVTVQSQRDRANPHLPFDPTEGFRGCAMIKSAANPGRALPGNLACRG